MQRQQILENVQESHDFSKVEIYEYKGRKMIVGSKAYVRHIAALKANATRLREYVEKKEKAHNAAVKAWITRRAENPKYMVKSILVRDMPKGGI